METVYVIVVTYNGRKWVKTCFSSIINSTIPLKAIAIDNGSTDGTPELIGKKYPTVEMIRLNSNTGFGYANNIGIKKAYSANADYVFLLNLDAWLERSTIEKLILAHKRQPEYDIVSPMHLNAKGSALDYGFSNYIVPDTCKELYSDFVVGKEVNHIYEASFVNAAGWLMTKKCISDVGGFNPSFYHYGEDVNYVDRLKYLGHKMGVYPGTNIYHDRENRPPNMKFENETETYKRDLILRISNPGLTFTFSSELRNLYLQLFIYTVSLNLLRLRKVVNQIVTVYKIDRKLILNNKKKSMFRGLTFLNGLD